MIAQLLAGRLRDALGTAGARHVRAIELEIEENFGQSASYREVFD